MKPTSLLIAAALAAGCASSELTGAAAARSRGAALPPPGPEDAAAPAGEAAPAAPAVRRDPWLDDASVIARVNGEVLTLRHVRHRMGRAYDEFLDQRDQLAQLVQKETRGLVLERLVIAEAKRLGLTVSDEEMEEMEEAEAKQAAKSRTTVAQTLLDIGITRREWEQGLRDRRLQARAYWFFTGLFPERFYSEEVYRPAVDAYVSPGEVRAWGEANRERLETPDQATLRVIDLRVTPHREAGATEEEAWRLCAAAVDGVEARLRAGEEFAAVAREVSAGPEREEGGLVGPIRPDGPVRAEFRDWAFRPGRKDGDVSERIRLPMGYVLLRMERREEARRPGIEEWGPGAREQLEGWKREAAWSRVQVRLLEEATVKPAAVKEAILASLREAVRKASAEIPRVPPPGTAPRTASAPVR
jgi:peptidyl-prolyl cis-trans isomerase SurA